MHIPVSVYTQPVVQGLYHLLADRILVTMGGPSLVLRRSKGERTSGHYRQVFTDTAGANQITESAICDVTFDHMWPGSEAKSKFK